MCLGNYINYLNENNITKRNEIETICKRQSKISTIMVIICSLLWTYFIYLWN